MSAADWEDGCTNEAGTGPDLKIRWANSAKIRLVRAHLLGLINRQDHNCAVIGVPLLRASPGCLAVSLVLGLF